MAQPFLSQLPGSGMYSTLNRKPAWHGHPYGPSRGTMWFQSQEPMYWKSVFPKKTRSRENFQNYKWKLFVIIPNAHQIKCESGAKMFAGTWVSYHLFSVSCFPKNYWRMYSRWKKENTKKTNKRGNEEIRLPIRER